MFNFLWKTKALSRRSRLVTMGKRHCPTRYRPTLEVLEERTLLSSIPAIAGPGLNYDPYLPAPAPVLGGGWNSDEVNSGLPTISIDSPYVYNLTAPAKFSITDDYVPGDVYHVFDMGNPILVTTFNGAQTPFAAGGNPAGNAAWSNSSYSHGSVLLGVGAHSLTIEDDGSGAGNNYPAGFWDRLDPAAPVQTQFQNTDILHKLLYAGQQLDVYVSVTNGLETEVQGQEAFYLSTNQNASVQGDTQLAVNGSVSVDLQSGQSLNLPQTPTMLNVVVPNDIQPGTYYLKATFAGNDDPSNNAIAVSPALTTCVDKNGNVSVFTYPNTAQVFDDAVSDVKEGTPDFTAPKTIADVQAFVQGQEGLGGFKAGKYFVYPDNGVPAIGWGSDLADKNGNADLTFKPIIQAYLTNNPTLPFTIGDFLHLNSGAYVDRTTALALFKAGFNRASQDVSRMYGTLNLTFSQQAALIDLDYNVGSSGLAMFGSMNQDLSMNTPFGFACAGLELVNSQRTTMISESRVDQDFFLLTNAPGVAALL